MGVGGSCCILQITTTGASINEILEDGTYNVCVTVENNVTSNNDCKEVSIANECDPKLGTIGTITGDDVACEGSEVSLSIAEVANADSYTWSTTSGSITGTGTSATLIASSDAVVTLEVENACGTKDASKTVTFEPLDFI